MHYPPVDVEEIEWGTHRMRRDLMGRVRFSIAKINDFGLQCQVSVRKKTFPGRDAAISSIFRKIPVKDGYSIFRAPVRQSYPLSAGRIFCPEYLCIVFRTDLLSAVSRQ
jgi:hypothetical protein